LCRDDAGMETRGRRSSSAASSRRPSPSFSVKRQSVSEKPANTMAAKPQLAKKRPALANLTNQRNGPLNDLKIAVLSKKPMVRNLII
ncbi:hypothetical protein U1Q18_037170, partial [Sarracenia purpurea var. burkii]